MDPEWRPGTFYLLFQIVMFFRKGKSRVKKNQEQLPLKRGGYGVLCGGVLTPVLCVWVCGSVLCYPSAFFEFLSCQPGGLAGLLMPCAGLLTTLFIQSFWSREVSLSLNWTDRYTHTSSPDSGVNVFCLIRNHISWGLESVFSKYNFQPKKKKGSYLAFRRPR